MLDSQKYQHRLFKLSKRFFKWYIIECKPKITVSGQGHQLMIMQETVVFSTFWHRRASTEMKKLQEMDAAKLKHYNK